MNDNALTTLAIRPATRREAKYVSKLAISTYTESFDESMSQDDLNAHITNNLTTEHFANYIENDMVLVAIIGRMMVGYAHLGAVPFDIPTPPNDSKCLRRMYISQHYRNQGIGSMLLNAALNQPLFQAARYIYLDVWEHNTGAINFYERFGFQIIDERRFVTASGQLGDLDYIMCLDTDPK